MPNQGKKQTVFQIKMVKIYAFFTPKLTQKPHFSTLWGRIPGPHLPIQQILVSSANIREFSPRVDFKETLFHLIPF